MNSRMRALAALLAVLLILSSFTVLLSSCDTPAEGTPEGSLPQSDAGSSGGTDAPTGDGTPEETEPPQTGELALVENGIAAVTIVASESATGAETDAVALIRSAISDGTGVEPMLSSDWIRPGTEHDPETVEILVGKTNYKETRAALDKTSYGSYRISVSGNKIVLSAWSAPAIRAGAEVLANLLSGAAETGNLVIARSELRASLVVDETVDDIPVVPNLTLDHIYDANGAYEAIYNRASLDDYNAYLAKLDADGYKQYATNARGDVHSAIYTDGKENTFHIFYEGGYRQLCVLIEEYDEEMLPPKAASYTKVCETQFAQVGLEYKYDNKADLKNVQNGMCYVWRLEDGRFIIMDGGFSYKDSSGVLLNVLREMAVDPNNIVIAAWIISHFHGDHVGALVSFVKNNLYKATVESLIFNLPTQEQSALDGMNWSGWNSIRTTLVPYNSDMVVYRAHPGQIYHFANAEIEILYTMEMTAPDDLVYYNTCSLITDVRFGDFNMMMLGDCSDVTNQNIFKNYGKALESEVVQVAHHGYQGGSTSLYRMINPIFVFWPAGATWYSTCVETGMESDESYRNRYFFMDGTRIKAVYPAKSTIVLFNVEKDTGFTTGRLYATAGAMVEGIYDPLGHR